MARKINQTGIDHIKQWEGLRLKAYRDIAGVWTIGYGHTAAAGAPRPLQGMQISEADAEAILRRDLTQYENAVEHAVKVSLNDNQFAVLVSFTYNVGIGAFQRSTLLKKLNSGDYDAVPSELMKWVNSGGKRIEGLVNRRAAEAGLWVKGAFVSSGYVPSHAHQLNPIIKPEALAPAIGALAGLAGFVSGSGPFQWALAAIMVVACGVGIWYFVRRVLESNP